MVRSELVSHPEHAADAMLAALYADGPHPDHAAELSLFGQFVGSWAIDNTYFHESGREQYEAEWRFGWTLDGRAVQDVLFHPAVSKAPATRAYSEGIGTTVRMFEPATADWTVIWFSATRGNVVSLRGRPDGNDIEIVGESRRGDSLRWRFFEITDDSFHWHGLTRPRDGGDWRLEQEMLAKRIA
jgi:hypothetical protein